ncbi:mobile element protein [Halorhodospira halochloris]|uniref:Mobile element protein n=1 Tax=Halorhodospira halochloris TaxID=1052 RepID=A0A0X8XBP2_HALHR|nr:IS21 family transposase [Halorhodospira halochloris]BAU58667.1 mobile element protein [Halorhodospira halochloris]
MAISKELEAQIMRYHYAEHWRVGTISRQLNVHTDVVHRVLAKAGIPSAQRTRRGSIIDPYVPWIEQTLADYPKIPASRLYDMARERGYSGGPDHFRHLISQYRPKPVAEAYMRLRTLPGEQAQVDWGHFGKLPIGRAKRPLMAFVMVLSYSRWIFLRFYLGSSTANFLRGHVAAFEAWQGVCRCLLYDNLKSAVLERYAEQIRFNPQLLDLSAHYGFEPRPVAVARGNEKGRVERAIRYVRSSFWPGRQFNCLDDLNEQAQHWCVSIAAERRCDQEQKSSVRQAFAEEQPYLRALPSEPFPCYENVPVKVGKTPYVRFDLNDYSVPHKYVRKTLSVSATLERIQVLDGENVIASHPRSYDRHAQIEDPRHIDKLAQEKQAARLHRGTDRLSSSVPRAKEFLSQAATRTNSLGSVTAALLRLLDHYGASELDAAIEHALERGVPHPHALSQILEQRRDQTPGPPSLPLRLPEQLRQREPSIRLRGLDGYDALTPNYEKDDNGPENT